MSLLKDQILLKLSTIQAFSGERPIGIKLTNEQIDQLCNELNVKRTALVVDGYFRLFGLRVEIIDD